jgi:hypothetical protein
MTVAGPAGTSGRLQAPLALLTATSGIPTTMASAPSSGNDVWVSVTVPLSPPDGSFVRTTFVVVVPPAASATVAESGP